MTPVLFFFFFFLPSGDLVANPEPAAILALLQTRLEGMIGQAAPLGPALLVGELARLERAIRHEAQNRVALIDGPSIELEANSALVFGETPMLPPETKEDGFWLFKPVVFRVVPHHLFIYSLRFKGDHTVRLKSVTLYFRDGTRIVQQPWQAEDRGDGVPFSKRVWVKGLRAWQPGEIRRARALAAIEILGSAQDYESDSRLSFFMEIPDPEARPFQRTMGLIADMKERWRGYPDGNSQNIQTCLGELARISFDLGIPISGSQ